MPTREDVLNGIRKLDADISKTERRLEMVRAKKRAATELYGARRCCCCLPAPAAD